MHFPIEPMLAMPGSSYTDEPGLLRAKGYAFEIKWDGIRCIAHVARDTVTLWSRSGRIINSEFPEIVADLQRSVPVKNRPVVLDGELVWMHEGYPDRQRLQNRLSASPKARLECLRYVMFDVLTWKGADLTALRYDERRSSLFYIDTSRSLYTSVSSTDGRKLWEIVKAANLEGVIAKPVTSRYFPGKRISWVKIKYNHRDVFQVVGYTDGEGTRSGLFGALILAQDVDGELLYGGKVGTGFTFQSARKLADLMDPLVVDESPIAPKDRPRALKHISSRRPIHWIRPELRAVVEYNDTSHDGIPLHPSFKGLDT